MVEYVAAGSRFKCVFILHSTIHALTIVHRIFLPKDNQVLTLVLSGIRAPRTARNPSETSEPYGPEASEFATRRYMQRDVEIEIHDADKSGGFIGALYVNKTENAAITLAREGLATVHAYSADNLAWVKQLYDAEVRICSGVWLTSDAHDGFSILRLRPRMRSVT